MKILDEQITIDELNRIALDTFGDLVKAVVDVQRRLIAVDAELHSDLEALLIENGSKQHDLWGINHKELAAGRWKELSLSEQLANVGSEVSRALNWREKGNTEYSLKAAARALELMDLSLDCAGSYPRLKELAGLREAIVDFFYGTNQFCSSAGLWRQYFDHFNFAARKQIL
jgi:hypothetical protein